MKVGLKSLITAFPTQLPWLNPILVKPLDFELAFPPSSNLQLLIDKKQTCGLPSLNFDVLSKKEKVALFYLPICHNDSYIEGEHPNSVTEF